VDEADALTDLRELGEGLLASRCDADKLSSVTEVYNKSP